MITFDSNLNDLYTTERLRVGSWLKFPIKSRMYKIDSKKSGYEKVQSVSNSKDQNVLCRFTGKKNEEKLVFLGIPSNFKVDLFGIPAYLNSDAIFNEMCTIMYSVLEYGITSRNLSESDYDEIIQSGMPILFEHPSLEPVLADIFLEAAPHPILKESQVESNAFMVGIKSVDILTDVKKKVFNKTYYLRKEHLYSFVACPIIEIPLDSNRISVLEDAKHNGALPTMPMQVFFE